MAERYYPRAEAERLGRAMLERARARLLAELPARFAARMRRGERIDREWGAAVDRIMAEELVRTRRELEALAVEGSA